MNHSWRKVLASFLVLVLIAVLGLSCGDDEEEGVVTIRLGEITDRTGPGSPAVITLVYALQDLVNYYNDEGLIPGVKLDIVSWDSRNDPAREIPGYEWVKEKGADIIITIMPPSGPLLKPFADKDKIPIASLTTHRDTLDPPGWVFNMSNSADMHVKTLMKWIVENHWDYDAEGRLPKFGLAGWDEVMIRAVDDAMEEYSQEHSDQVEYVDPLFVPFGSQAWGGEVESLKDCDYIAAVAFPAAKFIEAFRLRGHDATFIDPSTGAASYRGFFVDLIGYEELDGLLTSNSAPFWSDDTPVIDLAKELLDRYRPGQKEEVIYKGLAYCGGVHNLIYTLEILKNAIEEVGAENFDGQAFYDAAVEYTLGGPLFEGYPEWGFTETKRYMVDHLLVQEYDAEVEDIVTISDGWLPLMVD